VKTLMLFAVFLASVFASEPLRADKTDVIRLVNGDDVTGEVKSLDFGSLRYSTDSMGTVSVEWEEIVSIVSDQSLQIEVIDGRRYFGSLVASPDPFQLTVRTASNEVRLGMAEVVRITPIDQDETFLQRVDGSISFGFQTQKSSEVTTSNVSFDLSYRARQYLFGLRGSSSVTDQPNEPTSARQSLQGNYQRFRENRWFTEWFSGWEKNDELGVEGRVSAGAALGRYVLQSNRNQLSLTGGVQAARENSSVGADSTTNAEGRIELRFLHRRLEPEASMTMTATAYPLLEDLSSYRAEADLSWRREFIEDLFFDLTLGYSYLSDPAEGANSTDYVVTTSLGYSF